jgi:hypothetical protein
LTFDAAKMAHKRELVSLGVFEPFGAALLEQNMSDRRKLSSSRLGKEAENDSYFLSEIEQSGLGREFLPDHESEIFIGGER